MRLFIFTIFLLTLSSCSLFEVRGYHAIDCKFAVDPFISIEEALKPDVQKDWLCK